LKRNNPINSKIVFGDQVLKQTNHYNYVGGDIHTGNVREILVTKQQSIKWSVEQDAEH